MGRQEFRWLVALVMTAALILLGLTPAQAARRALVIGNDHYSNVPKLSNAGADAASIAEALAKAGWIVQVTRDRSFKQMQADVRAFRQSLSGGDELVVYFSGHGVQLGGTNYLLPTDVGSDSEEQVKDDSMSLSKLLTDLREHQPRLLLAIIDACRDNPFAGNGRAIGGRGLTSVAGASGQMVVYAAGEGQRALDRLGTGDTVRNGLFTRVLLKELARPGVPIREVLFRVRDEVAALAESVRAEQVPAVYDQVRGSFYFVPPVVGATASARVPAGASTPTPQPLAADTGNTTSFASAASASAMPISPKSASGLRLGQVLVYRITDLYTNLASEVRLRVDRIDRDRITFNGGERVEALEGGKPRDGQVQLGDLDRLAPPQGWQLPPLNESRKVEMTFPISSELRFALSGTVSPDRQAVEGIGEIPVVGYRLRMASNNSGGVLYDGELEVRYAPSLGRVVDFRVVLRSSNPSARVGLATRQRVQLVGIE